MNPVESAAKAQRALKTARLAQSDGDFDGCCNRAYYAMFHAARAALLAVGQPEAAMGKTHSGMIAAVGRHLVLTGFLSTEVAAMLGRESKRRMVIDYQADGATATDADEAIRASEIFVAAALTILEDRPSPTA